MDTFTSLRLPPDCPSRRAFAEVCRSIPTAKRLGKVWFVDAAAWRARRLQAQGATP